MLEEIINSKAKGRIVKLFCQLPKRKFQMIDVAKQTKLSNSRTSECLRELARIGILESRKIGKGYEYKLNLSNFYSNLLLKFFREEDKLLINITNDFVKNMKGLKGVKSIVLFGSALTGLKIGSDVDFLVIAENKIDREEISKVETKIIDKYGFHVSTTFMTEEELKEKAKKGEEFVINVIANGKLIFGKDLEDMIWSKK